MKSTDLDLAAFKASLTGDAPPEISIPLRALWYDGRGAWNAAHDELQDDQSSEGAWVHAYLHRKEGDLSNAAYWYRRAGRPESHIALDVEWAQIVSALLGTELR